MENNERLLEQQRTESVVRLPPSLVLRMLVRMRREQARVREEEENTTRTVEEEGEGKNT